MFGSRWGLSPSPARGCLLLRAAFWLPVYFNLILCFPPLFSSDLHSLSVSTVGGEGVRPSFHQVQGCLASSPSPRLSF
ncbi:hypothetical protein C8R46DRAFT_1066839 [Mycena filopes]|nr:hypothetical protein C8R46DRAFT_1066839 [Mycena filopes]